MIFDEGVIGVIAASVMSTIAGCLLLKTRAEWLNGGTFSAGMAMAEAVIAVTCFGLEVRSFGAGSACGIGRNYTP